MKTKTKKQPTSEFWIIDTETEGQTQGTCEARGPFASMAAVERFLVEDVTNLWQSSCSCIQSANDEAWCKPQKIVEVRRVVTPEITATVKLVEQ